MRPIYGSRENGSRRSWSPSRRTISTKGRQRDRHRARRRRLPRALADAPAIRRDRPSVVACDDRAAGPRARPLGAYEGHAAAPDADRRQGQDGRGAAAESLVARHSLRRCARFHDAPASPHAELLRGRVRLHRPPARRANDRRRRRVLPTLDGLSVARFYERFFALLTALGLDVAIKAEPYDTPGAPPFAKTSNDRPTIVRRLTGRVQRLARWEDEPRPLLLAQH